MAETRQDRTHGQWRLLLAAWERHCRSEGSSRHCSGTDATFLVQALSTALADGSHTPALGRAARSWGARFGTPVEALAAIFELRDAVTSLAEEQPGLADASAVAWVFDQVTMEVVDAVSTNLRSAARVDALTGCANRRALDEEMAQALANARRSGLDMAVVAIDLDGLKTVNDTEGHPAGDAALVALADTMRRALRKSDTLYRTGGDEFVVLTPFTDGAGAQILMHRAEQMGGPSFSWGVASAGVQPASEVLATDESIRHEAVALLAAADADLYARRRARRREQRRSRRSRRAVAVMSAAASVAVTSAALAAVVGGGHRGPAAQPGHGAQALPAASRPARSPDPSSPPHASGPGVATPFQPGSASTGAGGSATGTVTTAASTPSAVRAGGTAAAPSSSITPDAATQTVSVVTHAVSPAPVAPSAPQPGSGANARPGGPHPGHGSPHGHGTPGQPGSPPWSGRGPDAHPGQPPAPPGGGHGPDAVQSQPPAPPGGGHGPDAAPSQPPAPSWGEEGNAVAPSPPPAPTWGGDGPDGPPPYNDNGFHAHAMVAVGIGPGDAPGAGPRGPEGPHGPGH